MTPMMYAMDIDAEGRFTTHPVVGRFMDSYFNFGPNRVPTL